MFATVRFNMTRAEEGHHDAFLSACSLPYHQLETLKESYLHTAELAYLCTLAFEKRRYSYLLGRHAAKGAASAFMGGVDPREFWIHNGIMRQPLLYCQRVAEISSGRLNPAVTISHSHGVGVAAVFSAVHPLAVDLEWVDSRHERVIWEYTTESEKGLLAGLSLSAIDRATLAWTTKEALSKALLCGLSVPFKVLEIKSIEVNQEVYISHFTNFTQYKAHAVRQGPYWFSLVLPSKSQLEGDMAAMTALLAQQTPGGDMTPREDLK